jgi:hypothetical protein
MLHSEKDDAHLSKLDRDPARSNEDHSLTSLEDNHLPASSVESLSSKDPFPFIYEVSIERRRRAVATDTSPPPSVAILAAEGGYVRCPRKYHRVDEDPQHALRRAWVEKDFETHNWKLDTHYVAMPGNVGQYITEIEELLKHYEQLTDIPCFSVSREMESTISSLGTEYGGTFERENELFQRWILEHNTSWVTALLLHLHSSPTSLISRLPVELVEPLPLLVAPSYNEWPDRLHCYKHCPDSLQEICVEGGAFAELERFIKHTIRLRKIVWREIVKVSASLPPFTGREEGRHA